MVNVTLHISILFLSLVTSNDGINITKQSLEIWNCPSDKNGCDPPIILENSEKVWTNVQRSTQVNIDVLTEYKVALPETPLYIKNETTKVGVDTIKVRIDSLRG